MNDLEFAQRIDERIGELYSQAKASVYQFPKNTLTELRSIASLCCDLLRPDDWLVLPRGLHEKIQQLKDAHKINFETHEKLTELRRWGNWAAHVEDAPKDRPPFSDLAQKALDNTIILLETVFRQKHGGAEVPDYEIIQDNQEKLKDMSFRALFDNCNEAQYQVAMLLQQQLASKVKEAAASSELLAKTYEFNALENRSLDLLKYASDDGHPAASYHYGLALSKGKLGPENENLGANLIRMAADDGHIDALAWCGHMFMYGLHYAVVDYELARNYLEKAAAEDHPLALTLLSKMYREGLGVPEDKKAAYNLTRRAAEAGYPVAQYEAGVALWYGDGVEADMKTALSLIQQVSDAGLPEAQRFIGNRIRHGTVQGSFSDAEKLLKNATIAVNEAKLDLAELYMTRTVPSEWIAAANLVQLAYETALDDKNERIENNALQLAPKLVAKLEELSARMSDKDFQSFLFVRCLFDKKKLPFPKRKERIEEYLKAENELSKSTGLSLAERQRAVRKFASEMIPMLPRAPKLAPQNRYAAQPVRQRVSQIKIGRNEPCTCGSGRKSKVCCYK